MPADPRIAALPAVVALAETLAEEAHAAFRAAWPDDAIADPDGYFQAPFVGTPERYRTPFVQAQLALLSDLSRPESMDAVQRLIRIAHGQQQAEVSPETLALVALATLGSTHD